MGLGLQARVLVCLPAGHQVKRVLMTDRAGETAGKLQAGVTAVTAVTVVTGTPSPGPESDVFASCWSP